MRPVDDYSFSITNIEKLTYDIKLKCLNAEITDSFEAYSGIVEQVSRLADEVDKLMNLYARKAKERR